MNDSGRWMLLVVATVTTVAVLGLLATQLELSSDKDEPCGTTIRIDMRGPTLLRDRAADLEAEAEPGSEVEAARQAKEARTRANSLEERCKGRQEVALLILGTSFVALLCVVGIATYRLGRREVDASA